MPTTTFEHLAPSKKNRIIAALNQEFSQVPLATAQVARIIKTAQIARGSFYKYFSDLNDAYLYFYQVAIEAVHNPFQQLKWQDSQQLGTSAQAVQQMQTGPYGAFFKLHFTANASAFAAIHPSPTHQLGDPVKWAVATLSHATIQEIMLAPEHQSEAIHRLQTAIAYYTREVD